MGRTSSLYWSGNFLRQIFYRKRIFQVFVGMLPVLGAPSQMCMPYCLDDLVHAENSRIAGDVLFSFNFICLAIFLYLWRVNKKRKVSIFLKSRIGNFRSNPVARMPCRKSFKLRKMSVQPGLWSR